MWQYIAYSLEEAVRIYVYTIIIDISKAFELVSHYRLFTKWAVSGVDSRVPVWVREFVVGRTQRVSVGQQLSKSVKVISGVTQRSVLGPQLFLVYVNDIWRNIDWSIRLFADDCIIYREITNRNDVKNKSR